MNEHLSTFVGGFPAPLRQALGVWSEDWDELYQDQKNSVTWQDATFECTDFCEQIHAEGAEVLGRFTSDFYAGWPAITRNFYGEGTAYYLSTRMGADFLDSFLASVVQQSSVKPLFAGIRAEKGVSVRKRRGDGRDLLFLLNYNQHAAGCEIEGASLYDHGSDAPVTGKVLLQPFEVRVLATQPARVVTSG
jgi:beta-galactosidase